MTSLAVLDEENSSRNRPLDRLPPFAALRAFDVAARRLSFKEAAAELGVTPTAISHQIKRLEQDVGATLFHRRARSISLTPSGERFAAAIVPAMQKLRGAYRDLQGAGHTNVVTIGAGPLISSRWLAPRLSDFAAKHHEIELRLHHARSDIWRRMHEFDIVIAWGLGDWPDIHTEELLDLNVTPTFAPGLTDAEKVSSPGDLLNLPLLHLKNTVGWRDWFEARGLQLDERGGAIFEDANVLQQAALYGQGVALGYVEFIADDLRTGRLIQPLNEVTKVKDAYFATVTDDQPSLPVRRTWSWLMDQAEWSREPR